MAFCATVHIENLDTGFAVDVMAVQITHPQRMRKPDRMHLFGLPPEIVTAIATACAQVLPLTELLQARLICSKSKPERQATP